LDNEKLQVLSTHYSDTFTLLEQRIKLRDKFFTGILLLLVLMLFQIYTPEEASGMISRLISTKLSLKIDIEFLYVQSILWFFLLAVVIKYFQAVTYIERQYDYIHSLEKVLSNEYKSIAFTREGKAYLDNYPAFLSWASFLYTILFPFILFFICSAKIVGEFHLYGVGKFLIWFNVAMYLFLLVSLVLYLFGVHKKKKAPNDSETVL